MPFQAGFAPQLPTGHRAPRCPAARWRSAGCAARAAWARYFAPINRQNVELKLNIKPQINESDYIRMVINEQTEEIASTDPVLGPTTAKRTAKTTVVAKDQETVVIGGIMQERTIESVAQGPDPRRHPAPRPPLPRDQPRSKMKTNLLLFLTPYIIRDPRDFRRIFERKMKERQQFVEQFYGQVPGYDVPIDFTRKPGPLAQMNQLVMREELQGGERRPGLPGEQVFRPGRRARRGCRCRPASPAPARSTPIEPRPPRRAPSRPVPEHAGTAARSARRGRRHAAGLGSRAASRPLPRRRPRPRRRVNQRAPPAAPRTVRATAVQPGETASAKPMRESTDIRPPQATAAASLVGRPLGEILRALAGLTEDDARGGARASRPRRAGAWARSWSA